MSFWSRITRSGGAAAPPAAAAPVAAAETVLDPQAAERLDHLFRHGARQGAVNPLRFAVQRYRQQQQQQGRQEAAR